MHLTTASFSDGPATIAFVLDLTERKRVEQALAESELQLNQAQKMDAIGRLAGGVAHDFNNLLSLILNYTGFVMKDVPEGDPRRSDLAQIKKAAERAAALTRQLLAFSRKQVLQPVELDLNQIVGGMEEMLQRMLGEDVDFVQMLAPDLGLTLADPGQIEQFLMNLVVNARDAMPDGGKLTIETANVELDEEHAASFVGMNPGSFVRLAVTDTGCGIDQQIQARIFEPFFTTKEKDKGTGLGLSTVFGIVRQSGGDIRVASEPGQGSKFSIYLPRELSGAVATPIPHAPAPGQATGTETVLVVEDEEDLRSVARRILVDAGYSVLSAAGGMEALRMCEQHKGKIHLVLTDVIMPGMSGKALADRLAETFPGTKVLFMSGYTDDAIAHHGVLDSGTHFLAKPFVAADLARKVRAVLDGGVTPSGTDWPAVADEARLKERPLEQAALRALPEDVRRRLFEAGLAARYDEIVEMIETLRPSEPAVATELRRMADAFDYDGIRRLLQ
jgi:nitrogen-specific signal transduction histidine kinase/FixJ family two-component response regulator